MPIEDFIIMVYCLIDNEVKELQKEHPWRKRGFKPKLTDSEALTLATVGEYLGFDAEKHIWSYFKQHWLSWFPALGTRTTFTRQLANLWEVKARVREMLLRQTGSYQDTLYMIDGFPMPVCGFRRVPIAQCFKGNASYGYCRAKSLSYYGFHGNMIVNDAGFIMGFSLTAANVDERQAMWDMVAPIQGRLIGDKGYVGKFHQLSLQQEQHIELLTPKRQRDNFMQQSTALRKLILNFRKRIETVIGQLTEQFHIQRVRARDLWHLTARINRKLLAHTLAMCINQQIGNKPLQLAQLQIL